MVRAKMTVQTVTSNGATNPEDQASTVVLLPVTAGSEENKEFYRWTPGGKVELGLVNESTAAQFIPGKSYYVDFTPAED